MPSATHRQLREFAWDGRTLSVQAGAGTTCTVALDGSRFIELQAASDGVATLELAFSPSGNACLMVSIGVNPEPAESEPAIFEIVFGTAGIRPCSDAIQPLRPLTTVEQLVPLDVEPMDREVTVIIPVYNASAAVLRCLESVLAHTTGPSRLIVIDDASTDPQIAPLLQRYRGIDAVEVLFNPHNLGFTATANRGIALANRADVVLLNADTEVAANWLTGLRRAVHSGNDIATATAVSDNAGAFSVPDLERENTIPPQWTFAQTARALWQEAGHVFPQLPTGNGFCMYIRRKVLDEVGALDVEAFPQGYGEENDFCQRACAAGYGHVIAGNVFVAHARSQSFGVERREALGRAGMQILRERWPHYEADVGATLFSFERRVLDWRVRRMHATACAHSPLPRVLRYGERRDSALSPGYDVWMLSQTGNDLALCRPGLDTAEQSNISSINAATVSIWLQRHAIEFVELGETVEARVAALIEAQARRLGIAVIAARSNDKTGPDRLGPALSALQSFRGRQE